MNGASILRCQVQHPSELVSFCFTFRAYWPKSQTFWKGEKKKKVSKRRNGILWFLREYIYTSIYTLTAGCCWSLLVPRTTSYTAKSLLEVSPNGKDKKCLTTTARWELWFGLLPRGRKLRTRRFLFVCCIHLACVRHVLRVRIVHCT
jgi:hypothetical protein